MIVYEVDDLSNLIGVYKNRKIVPEKMIGSFDWLSCTFNCFTYCCDTLFTRPILDQVSKNKLKPLLKIFDKENNDLDSYSIERGSSNFRYRISIDEGATLLFYGSETINGVPATALNLSGSCCQRLIRKKRFIPLLKWCLKNAYNFTRFDSSIDNFSDVFPLSTINDLIVNKCYVSNFKKPFKVIGTPNEESVYKYDGVTYYLGNESDLLLRIYAKNWEQERQEEIKDWIRFEIQLRDDKRIRQLITMILIGYETNDYSNYFGIVAGLLKEIVMFKVPGKNKQKCRWEDHPEYLRFLQDVENIKLFKAPKGKGKYVKTKEWFQKSCSLFLTQAFLVEGRDKFFDYIKYIVNCRFEQMTEDEFNIVINELEDRGQTFDYNKAYVELGKMKKEYDWTTVDNSFRIEEGIVLKKEEKEEDEEESMI